MLALPLSSFQYGRGIHCQLCDYKVGAVLSTSIHWYVIYTDILYSIYHFTHNMWVCIVCIYTDVLLFSITSIYYNLKKQEASLFYLSSPLLPEKIIYFLPTNFINIDQSKAIKRGRLDKIKCLFSMVAFWKSCSNSLIMKVVIHSSSQQGPDPDSYLLFHFHKSDIKWSKVSFSSSHS